MNEIKECNTCINCIKKLNSMKGGELAMGVSAKGEKYRCEICGNEVVVEKVGGGTLVCCGEEMSLVNE
jgi:desulfoferrodoxin-like iron-binding protein